MIFLGLLFILLLMKSEFSQGLLGAIEAGGTKCVAALSDASGTILEKISVPTTSPEETFSALRTFFLKRASFYGGQLEALAVGSFGPVELEETSSDYGRLLETPKVLWRGASWQEVLGDLAPLCVVSDVEAAGIGEAFYGGGRACRQFIYITVGTGVGGACIYEGRILKGFPHAEMGHLYVPQEAEDALVGFRGSCPSHELCWEGMASGTSLVARWGAGVRIDEAQKDLVARYLASGLYSLVACFAPERILVGGGVGLIDGVLEKTRQHLAQKMSSYFGARWELPLLATSLARAECGAEAGILGALHLARELREKNQA